MPSTSAKQHRFMEAIAHNKAFAKKAGVPQSVGKDFSNADKGKTFKKGGDMKRKESRGKINPMALAALMGAGRPPAGAPMARPPMPMPASMPPPPPPGAGMGAGMPPGGAPGMARGGLSKEQHKNMAHHHMEMAEHHMSMHEGEKMRNGGKVKKYAVGGAVGKTLKSPSMKRFSQKETIGPRGMDKDVEKGSNKLTKFGESAVQKKGHTKDRNLGDSGPTVKPQSMRFANGGSVHTRADGIAKRGHTKTKYC